MTTILIVLSVVNTAILVFLLVNRAKTDDHSLQNRLNAIVQVQERGERMVRDDIAKNREELSRGLESFRESFGKQILDLIQRSEEKLEKVRGVIDAGLRVIQQDNNNQLEKMRVTVDEKLHTTLEKRLGESFRLVGEQLEKVHQGLGEMQTLASGVGDLKRVLSNVKTRGVLGEVQLGTLLDQILTPDQYEKNVVTKKGTRDPVEFAIKFPGRDGVNVFLPIDSKFPLEDYARLQDAQERGDALAVEEAAKALERRLKDEAKTIRDKYLDPPQTTDFGILFLATEGLYAEVLRRPGLFELLQRDYRITVAGPTTIAAMLSSFQMGFRTLAVEKRASEVWSLLSAVKTEFSKFGEILEKTQKKLQEASHTIDEAASKSRRITQKLKGVEALPSVEESIKSIDVSSDLDREGNGSHGEV